MKRAFSLLLVPALLLAGYRHRTPVPTGDTAPMAEVPVPAPPAEAPPVEAPVAPQPSPDKVDLQVALQTDKAVYGRGEPVKLTITARNNTKAPVAVTFTSGQQFEVEATREGAKTPAWHWSAGRFFTMNVRTVRFAAGEERRFEATWDGTSSPEGDAKAAPIPPGRYVLRAKLAAPGVDAAPPVTIELK